MKKTRQFDSKEASELWRKTVSQYDLEAHHIRLLESACECVDRIRAAAAAIARDGEFIHDRYGCPKAHPGLAVERDNKTLLARLIRELGLDLDTGPEVRIPRR